MQPCAGEVGRATPLALLCWPEQHRVPGDGARRGATRKFLYSKERIELVTAPEERTLTRRRYALSAGAVLTGASGCTASSSTVGEWVFEPDRRRTAEVVRATSDTVFVVDFEGDLVALEPDTGDRRWHVGIDDRPISAPTPVGDTAYVTWGSGVTAVDEWTGAREWTDERDLSSSSPPPTADDVVYVATASGDLVGLTASGGAPVWGATVPERPRGQPTAGDGTVFTATEEAVYAFDGATGDRRWRTELSGPRRSSLVTGTPLLSPEVVALDVAGNELVGLSRDSGEVRWRRSTAPRVPVSPRTVEDVLLYAENGVLTALAASTGWVRWALDLPESVGFVAPGPDRVYLWTDSTLRAVDLLTGSEEWTFDGVDEPLHVDVADGTAYVVERDGAVHAVPIPP